MARSIEAWLKAASVVGLLACSAPTDPAPPQVQPSEIFFRWTRSAFQPTEIWSIRPDGTGLRRRFNQGLDPSNLAIDPGGRLAVFRDGLSYYRSSPDGERAEPIPSIPRSWFNLAIDPLGTRVAATEEEVGKLRLWMVDLVTGQTLRVSAWPDQEFVATKVMWWPSGDSVLVSGFDISTSDAHLEVVQVRSGSRRIFQSVAVGPTGTAVALSLDGRKLAVAGFDRGEAPRLWIRILDLARNSYVEYPLQGLQYISGIEWSPAQDAIALDTGGRGLQILDLSTRQVRVLLDSTNAGQEPLWRPVP